MKIKKYYFAICAVLPVVLIGMEEKKQEMQSMIELFTGIKKQNYDFLPGELKTQLIDEPLMQLLLPNKRPWHYIEHIINDGSLSLCFTGGNQLVSANTGEISYFDVKSGENISVVSYTKARWDDEVCLNRDGTQFAMVGDGVGKVFDIQKKELCTDIFFRNSYIGKNVEGICFNDQETQVAVASTYNNAVIIFDALSGVIISESCFRTMLGRDLSISALCFDSTGQWLAVGSGNGVCINKVLTDGKLEEFFMIPDNRGIASLGFNNDGTLLVVALYNGSIDMVDSSNGRYIYSLFFDEWTRALCFDKNSQRLAFASNPYYTTDKIIRIINRYDDFTIDQLMLRELMELWLQVQKPKKSIKSAHKLFKNMSQLFYLDRQELNQVWLTFPDFMRVAITKTMTARIARYGKHKKSFSQHVKKRKVLSFRNKK